MMNNRLDEYLVAKADLTQTPIIGNFELSPICNMNCKMCYVRKSAKEVQSQGGLKSAKQWLKLAKEARDLGMLFLLLTGGEVFLYKEFKYLYEELSKMGFVLTINTNATLINEENIKWLAKNPPRCINVTLYGSSNDTYGHLCECEYGFDKVSRAIDLLLKYKLNVKINSTIIPDNLEDFKRIYEFANERGLPMEIPSYIFPPTRKDLLKIGENERFTPFEAANFKIMKSHINLSEKEVYKDLCNYISKLDNKDSDKKINRNMRCRAGKSSFWITWDGKMTPCGMMNYPYSQPFEEGFEKAWEKIKLDTKNIKLSKKCSICEKKEVCMVCAASAVTETGDFQGTPSYLCEMMDYEIQQVKNLYEELKNKYEDS